MPLWVITLDIAEEWHMAPWVVEEELSKEWYDRYVTYQTERHAAQKQKDGEKNLGKNARSWSV